jgi:hypothetical protein
MHVSEDNPGNATIDTSLRTTRITRLKKIPCPLCVQKSLIEDRSGKPEAKGPEAGTGQVEEPVISVLPPSFHQPTLILQSRSFAIECAARGEPDPQKQAEVAALMHDLGIAMNYACDERLRDTTVLRPDWLANGIYAVLRANLFPRGGRWLPTRC